MSSTIGVDGKTYVKTNGITLSTPYQSSDNNYYGDYNSDVYIISTDGITFTNNNIILGGGGKGTGAVGKNGLVNSANNITINNLGAFLGGGGAGIGGSNGGAGGGGGGDSGSGDVLGGEGGSIITSLDGGKGSDANTSTGKSGGGGGGGPTGRGGGTGFSFSYLYLGTHGGNGLYSSGNDYSGSDGGDVKSKPNNHGGYYYTQGGRGGGGYGGGNGGKDQNGRQNGGGGGGGGRGYANGGYGIRNNGTITKLVNLQGSSVPTTDIAQTSPYLYGPLYFAGNAPSSYVMQITSQYSFGQLWCTGVGNPSPMQLTDFSVEPSLSFANFNEGTYILSNVLLNVSLTGNPSGLFNSSNNYYHYAWSLQPNTINTGYDLKLVVTSGNYTDPSTIFYNWGNWGFSSFG